MADSPKTPAFGKTIKQMPPTRKKCKFCGSEQAGICGFYFEDLCPDDNPADMEEARERIREDPPERPEDEY